MGSDVDWQLVSKHEKLMYDSLAEGYNRLRAENAELRERLSQIAEVVRTAPSQFFQHRASEKIANLVK